MNHILTHSVDYEKPQETRNALEKLLGAGTLLAPPVKVKIVTDIW